MLLFFSTAALATASTTYGAASLVATDPIRRKALGRTARKLTVAWLFLAVLSMHMDSQDENAVAAAFYGASFTHASVRTALLESGLRLICCSYNRAPRWSVWRRRSVPAHRAGEG